MRTFVAVEVSSNDILNSIKKFQSEIDIKAKPVEIQNIHFTLLFLGEVTESVASKIQDALNSIEFSPFSITFRGVGAFPKPSFPRVVWIGTDKEGGDRLKDLAKKVEDVLSPIGFQSDKPFKPHITIFRIKSKIGNISRELAKYNETKFGSQEITEIKFKKSELTPNGPIYSDLQVVKAKS